MKTGIKERMNMDFSETYDQEDDVYYVTFKTGEPSYCVEVDDILLLEVGVFTHAPTGFRILNFHKNNVKSVHIRGLIRKIKDSLEEAEAERPRIELREQAVARALEKVLA